MESEILIKHQNTSEKKSLIDTPFFGTHPVESAFLPKIENPFSSSSDPQSSSSSSQENPGPGGPHVNFNSILELRSPDVNNNGTETESADDENLEN